VQASGSGAQPSRAAILLVAAGLTLATTGCMYWDADIRVARNGSVTVQERATIDPEWKAEIGDSLQAVEKVMKRYVAEAKKRGAKVKAFGSDSARADFQYPSLAAFARAWPDSSDEGKRWDRSLYHRLAGETGPLDELILFRQSPPQRTKQSADQRYPVLTLRVTPPVPAVRHNAHAVQGSTYYWRFTEKMTRPDSVWIVWPASESR